METKILSNATHKCVLVIDNAQPTGIVANIASVLSMTLGCRVSNIVSHDVYDKQGERHLGITTADSYTWSFTGEDKRAPELFPLFRN